MARVTAAFVSAVGLAGTRRAHLSSSVLRASLFTRAVVSRRCAAPRPAPARASVFAAAKTQQETDWNPVSVVENSKACEEHRYIVINVGVTGETGSLCDAYRIPGMYVQIRQDASGKPGFFAISCGPNLAGYFEFLIKETPGTEWICGVKAGDTVEMSPVMGKGFPIVPKLDLLTYPPIPEEEKPLDLLLFATGSGIAPIRAAIESPLNGLNVKARRSVKLYYGARYAERMAFMDRFKLWESDGIEVVPVMSRPGDGAEAWTGRTGYIQDVLKSDGIAAPKQTGVLLCGVKGMTEDTKALLLASGVPEDRILFNF